MPRPKVDERFRKRISKACLHCQKTKQKCDGLMPCRKCVRRNQTSSCVYSTHERSYGRRRNRRNRIDSRDAQRIEPNTSASPPSYPTEPNGRPTNVYGANGTVKEPEVAVPGLSQVLYDNKGRIGYAADVSNLSVVEELPPIQDGSLDPYTTRNIDELKNLIDVFFVSSFYQHGRQLALLELTNDPTIETIQAFTLISIYMLGCSWRNGASLNLGIAISAAKSLGYHQDDTNSVYDREERHRRAQVWKTLHYHDLFFSAMMGRSSSTSNSDLNIVDYEHSAQDGFDDEFDRSLSMCESLRAFLVIERAVNKVYTKKTVSLGILQSLTCELQVKSINLPQSLRMPAASDTLHGFRRTQEVNLRNAHVACSYYFAMMLLTRPFLITTLRAKSSTAPSQSTQGLSNQVDGNISSEIASGARTCIDSATYTVQLLHELLDASMLFKNMPFVV
ncbi:hypothetical protein BDV59DRAFT_191355 [Aspergillus ambiguus]|uniref:uncharacterized protein n=1 Tax=Aspergillus ambiguus TaxID=176160 RepID=UPI003CCE4A7B